MSRELTGADPGLHTSVLDHAGEFVARVAEETPVEYRRMLAQESVKRLLAADNRLNQGKLYAWAEYRVFQREFRARFPEASHGACINAFCKLFLKNDISMSNLAEVFESEAGEDLRRLRQTGPAGET